ncbi:MAG TPA: hypothetical protein VNM48_07235, partial [Chloroflexota bacterium]|nr:hypothetical protein [Chloroflexota bacterium]
GDATALVLALSLLVAALIAAGWRAAPRSGASSLQAGVLAGAWLAPPLYEWNNVMLLIVLLPAVRLGWARGRRTAVACWCAFASLSTVTYALYLVRPSEARLVWPVLALAIYLAPLVSRALGRCGATALPPAVSSPATRM